MFVRDLGFREFRKSAEARWSVNVDFTAGTSQAGNLTN